MSSATRILELITTEQQQYLVYIALSLGVAACTGMLSFYNSALYKPFFGRINPVLVVVAVSFLGIILLTVLLARGWFSIYMQNLHGLAVACGLAALFGLVMILFDSKIVFPADVNRPFPDSLLFYPSIGFVVEILFHVLPLTVLLIVLTTLFKTLTFESIIWPCIFFVALLEPVFQTALGFSRPVSPWATGFVALHIFLLNLCQLFIFKRYDFVSMYAFRLMYYLLWHILWGVFRLKLLF